ncbi:MAG: hypothetical protein ACLSGI_00325 [Butyricicoccaceae bacterium]
MYEAQGHTIAMPGSISRRTRGRLCGRWNARARLEHSDRSRRRSGAGAHAGRLNAVDQRPSCSTAHTMPQARMPCVTRWMSCSIKRLHAMGMVRDKDYETCVHEVASRADDFTPVRMCERSPDAHDCRAGAAAVRTRGIRPEHAIELALEHAKMNDRILICGSRTPSAARRSARPTESDRLNEINR